MYWMDEINIATNPRRFVLLGHENCATDFWSRVKLGMRNDVDCVGVALTLPSV